jgi:hexosaminidase
METEMIINKLKKPVLLCLVILSQAVIAQINIIPMPNTIKQLDGNDFVFNKNTRIVADADLQSVAKMLDEFLSPALGFHLSLSAEKPTNNVVVLKLNSGLNLGEEGYWLKADSNSIIIEANKPAGIFYGIQTLRQLLPAEIFNKYKVDGAVWKVPPVEIEDIPQFGWRGQHLDVSRHFFPVEFIKKYIDLMAIHKLNRFHWHLTDDQGWRIEIKKYPKLTKIGAWRNSTRINDYRNPNRICENKRYGGCYTKRQIREIVQYAKERYIEILPEIEMPGHSGAAVRSYPWLSCNGQGREYCLGKEEVFKFNEDVLREVMDLFPGKYIHIGSDEVKKTGWKNCSKCHTRMIAEGIEDINNMQPYFTARIEKFVTQNGRIVVGWDEILNSGLNSQSVLMCWRNNKYATIAANQGCDVIMVPTSHCYFDLYQGDKAVEPLANDHGFVPLDKVYSYNPIPADLTPERQKHILGVQACLWTEYIRTPERAEYMTYPRLCALAEVAWTEPQKKNYDKFLARLKEHFKRFDYYGVNFRRLYK